MNRGPYVKIDEDTVVNKFEMRDGFPDRRNNTLVQAMYAMYSSGKSLPEVGKIYHRHPYTINCLFKRRGFKMRGRNWQPFQEIDGIRFTRRSDGYFKRQTYDNGKYGTLFAHRYVWEKHNGPVPLGYCITHLNLDRSDNSIGNLVCKPIAEIKRESIRRSRPELRPRKTKAERFRMERERMWERANAIG